MAKDAPHYHGHRSRLKEKYRSKGLDAFEDYEALELLLFFAQPRKDVKPAAKELIKKFGDLKRILEADCQELERVDGMGKNSATLVSFIRDLAVRYLEQTARKRTHLGSTPELIRYCRAYFSGAAEEEFRVIYLDSQHHIIHVETLQVGTVNQAPVYPRKVLERALTHKASGIILVHNHPSGYAQPSSDDTRITRTIVETARKLDIRVHDHLIIGGDTWYSFREKGDMDRL